MLFPSTRGTVLFANKAVNRVRRSRTTQTMMVYAFISAPTASAEAVSAAAAVVQTVVVAIAAVYGLIQLAEARRARRVDTVLPIFDRLHSPEAAARRRRVYNEIGPAFPTLNSEQEAVMQEVISDFYLVGYLVERGLVEFALVADLYYGTVVRCWRACAPYIERDRERRGTRYASYFELFYYRCLSYGAETHSLEAVNTFRDESTSSAHLGEELQS